MEEQSPFPFVLKFLGIVAVSALMFLWLTSRNGEHAPGDSESAASPATATDAAKLTLDDRPTLDNRPTYKGLKPPVKAFSTPGVNVRDLKLPNGSVYVGQNMLKAGDILPAADREDAEDDPEITITSPFGNHIGMTFVYRYTLPDGRTTVIRYRRKVPYRPFTGEAGTVQHPFAIFSITIEP